MRSPLYPAAPSKRYNFRVAGGRFLGVDLAWREGTADVVANETGSVIDGDGRILDADWTRGVEQTIGWAGTVAGDGDAVLFADAPLVVRNETGQRLCETQVGQRYGRWRVSANTTNMHSPRLAGVQFLRQAGLSGWRYSDGSGGPPNAGRFVSETYPYATLVGAAELGYDTERPRYKRKPPRLRAAQWRAERAANCDTLIERLGQLADADPPLLLQSHPVTRELAEQPSPVGDAAYKHREDLIDALLCAWTASLWVRHGFDRCQVLGLHAKPTGQPGSHNNRPRPATATTTAVTRIRTTRGMTGCFQVHPLAVVYAGQCFPGSDSEAAVTCKVGWLCTVVELTAAPWPIFITQSSARTRTARGPRSGADSGSKAHAIRSVSCSQS